MVVTKKIIKKTSTSEPKALSKVLLSMMKWFFKPDVSQRFWLWIVRAVLFVVVIAGLAKFQISISVGAISFAIGLFLFMPRKYLDRESFVATFWTFAVLFMVFAGTAYMTMKHVPWEKAGFNPWIIGIQVLGTLAIISGCGVIASITCFARKIGISKIATLLNFPIGITFIKYIGYFLPIKSEPVIAIKYNWYKKLVSFLLNTKNGQLMLFLAVMILVAIMPTPWELFFILFFGVLYFWKHQNWMVQNVKKLAWASAIMNVIFIAAGIVYYYYYYVPSISVGIM